MNGFESMDMLREALEKAKEIAERTGDTEHCFICEKKPIVYMFKTGRYICSDCLYKMLYCCATGGDSE